MSRLFAPLAFTLACTVAAPAALAQPAGNPDDEARSVTTYVYLMDNANNRVLVSTHFWRTDLKYDERAFKRFMDVLAALEKKGFRIDPKATIESWDKPVQYARCYIYLEDLQAGQKAKGSVTTGSRVWCVGAGISEAELRGSDTAPHTGQVLQRFDLMLGKATGKGK